jgi:maltooligosyltrehalose trehalohydrolase
VRPIDAGGYGFDALWNDDFHHSALVALTGRNEAYYKDYSGAPQEFVSTAKYGYLYQGQWYSWQKHDRGASALDLEPWNFVTCLQNHDQVANTARGERPNVIAAPARYRAMTALLLLGPSTPMLFQGQEFGATTPFLYFSDHKPELSRNVIKGRRKFLAQFPSMATAAAQARIPDPAAPSTFLSSKLDFTERERNREMYKLHRDLLRLRAEDPVLSEASRRSFDGATLGANAFLLRYFGGSNGDRMLIVNLGNDLAVNRMPEPLVAPPGGRRWALLWSSEDPQYGGSGAVGPRDGEHWIVPGNSSVFVVAAADSDKDKEAQ